jgi:hypothetical protein
MSFGLKGDEATRVADLLAAAANASSSGISDLGMSLSQASAVAAMTKRPVEDVVTQLALMANAGLKGADAGTSVKSMLMALISPSSTAAGAMKSIGFNAYEAGGQLKTTRQIIDDMTKALKGKTDAQKNSLLADIFGSDGIRAAAIVMKDGVNGYDKMREAVTKQGAAAQLAAAQNAGFKGAVDALQSSIETVAIDVGMKALPALTSMAKTLGDKVEPAFDGLKSAVKTVSGVLSPAVLGLGDAIGNALIPALKDVAKSDIVRYIGGALVAAVYAALRVVEVAVRTFATLASQLSQATSVLVALTAGVVAYNVITGAMTAKTIAMTAAQVALNTAMRLNPMVLVASAAIGIVTAYTQVVLTSDRTTLSTEALRAAQNRLTETTNMAKFAQDKLSDAYMRQEGSALAVERAQRSYNEAVANYGPSSLEAREAAYNLKGATDALAQANAAVRDRTNEAKQAEQDKRNAAADVVKANDAVKESAYRAAGGYAALAGAIRDAKTEDAKSGVNGGFGGKNQTNAVFGLPKGFGFATGTVSAPGGSTLVGEMGPERVNLPKGAQVVPAYRTRATANGGGGASINIENLTIANQMDEQRFLANLGWRLSLR